MTKRNYGEVANTIRSLAARPEGVSLKEAAEAVCKTMNQITVYLSAHLAAELVKSGPRGNVRYFKSKEDADRHTEQLIVAKAKAKRVSVALKNSGIVIGDSGSKKLHMSANITWPEHVKVQYAPTTKDERFTFEPPSKSWRGVISADQDKRRMATLPPRP